LKIANRKSLRSSPERVKTVSGTIDPRKLSRFEEIGRGAMGVVYKAIYRGSHVAIKQVLINLADYESLKLLAQEATLMEELRHPNIVQFLGYYQDSTHYCHGNRKEPFSEIKNRFDVVPSVLRGIRPLVNRDKAPSTFITLMEQCWAQRVADRPEMEEVVNTLDQMEPEVKSFRC